MRFSAGVSTVATAALLVLATLAGGCAGVKIESRVDGSRVGALDRIFILSHLASVSEDFGEWCEESMRQAFWEVGVEAEVLTVDPMALDSDRQPMPPRGFSPDAVMVIKPRLLRGVHVDRVSQATLDAAMYDPIDEARFWRATITVVSGGDDLPLQKNAAETMAARLVERILKDGFVPPPT